MKKLKLLLGIALTGIGVALTYHIFENAVHWSIDKIWYDIFNTDDNRWIVPILTIAIGLMFYGAQHLLDKKSENKEEHGLGNAGPATISDYSKVLFIGFFSLVAGASLGPEAILVPASIILGGLVAKTLLSSDSKSTKIMAAAGIMALFTAFFNSMLIGVLSIFLVMKQSNTKFKPILLVVAVIASGFSFLTLNLVEGESYAQLPSYNWSINLSTVVISLILVAIGFIIVNSMDFINHQIKNFKDKDLSKKWWIKALIAGTVLGILYLLGGPLVEFTGNRSIQPMFEQAKSLGLTGLLWILIVKIFAISWSKTIGYRGGMIFPTIFLAAVLVAIVQLYVADFNMIYGLIAVIAGALISNKNNHTLV